MQKSNFRFDVMITSYHNPYLLLECKSPEISIDSKAIDQLFKLPVPRKKSIYRLVQWAANGNL